MASCAASKDIRRWIFFAGAFCLMLSFTWQHRHSSVTHRTTTYMVTLSDLSGTSHVIKTDHQQQSRYHSPSRTDQEKAADIGSNVGSVSIKTSSGNVSIKAKGAGISDPEPALERNVYVTPKQRILKADLLKHNDPLIKDFNNFRKSLETGGLAYSDPGTQLLLESTRKQRIGVNKRQDSGATRILRPQPNVLSSRRSTSKYKPQNTGGQVEINAKDDWSSSAPPQKCPLSWVSGDRAINSKVEPMIKLDPIKFLLPILANGPNNQLSGLRDSIYIAIRLNRTLVLPHFLKHRTDSQSPVSNFIDPGHRIDFQFLLRLVSFVTLEQFRESCHGNAMAVLRVREMSGLYRKVEGLLGLPLIGHKKKENTAMFIKEYPIEQKLEKSSKNFAISPNEAAIKEMYGTKMTCAIHPYPFKNLKITEVRPDRKNYLDFDLLSTSNVDLYSMIIRHTRLPMHVKNIAIDFLNQEMKGQRYLSVHWRFDKSDWMKSCLKPSPQSSSERTNKCQQILTFKPDHVARAIAEKVQSINLVLKLNIRDVYIASPPAEVKLVMSVKAILKKEHNYNIHNYEDVLRRWKANYRSCDWLWYDVNDILSTVEMEICARGAVFLRSFASTWSNSVHLARTRDLVPKEFSNKDDEIFRLVQRSRDDAA